MSPRPLLLLDLDGTLVDHDAVEVAGSGRAPDGMRSIASLAELP